MRINFIKPLIATVCVLGLVTACTKTESELPEETATTPTTINYPPGDGALRIGTMFQTTGSGADYGRSQIAAVELALLDIAKAGGVGFPILSFHRNAVEKQSGETLNELLNRKVDLVIGSANPKQLQLSLNQLRDSETFLVNTSYLEPALNYFDQDGQLLDLSTSPEVLGEALAVVAQQRQAEKINLVYLPDQFGNAISRGLKKYQEANKAESPVESEPNFSSESQGEESNQGEESEPLVFSKLVGLSSEKLSGIAGELAGTKSDLFAVYLPTTEAEILSEFLGALVQAGVSPEQIVLLDPNYSTLEAKLQEIYSKAESSAVGLNKISLLDQAQLGSKEFADQIQSADPWARVRPGAVEAYDAVIVVALAALRAKDDSPQRILAAIPGVTGGDVKCYSFAECAHILKTTDRISYQGINNSVAFGEGIKNLGGSYQLRQYGEKLELTVQGEIIKIQ